MLLDLIRNKAAIIFPRLLAVILFIIFLLSLYQKLFYYESFKNTLIGTDLFTLNVVHYFSLTILILEFITCYFLYYKLKIGLLLVASLLSLYILYIVLLKMYYIYPVCSCGGIIAQLPFRSHLLSNIILLVTTILALLVQVKHKIKN